MNACKFLLTVFLFCLFSLFAHSQQWAVYNTTNSGLPDDWVKKIVIDTSGNKWMIDISNNLVKYDGISWTVYNSSNSGLPNATLNSLCIDKNNNLLISTNIGLVKFYNSVWTGFTTSNSCLPSNHISDCDVDSLNNIWLATDSGIVKFDSSYNCIVYVGSNGNPFGAEVKVDSRNWIWTLCFSHTGPPDVSVFNGSIWQNYTSAAIGPYVSPSHLFCDILGNVWGSAYNGILKYNGTTFSVPYDTSMGATFFSIGAVYANNDFLAAASLSAQTLDYYDGNAWSFYNQLNSPLNHLIFDFACDHYNNLWIAGENGLFEFNPNGILYDIPNLQKQNVNIIAYPNPADKSFFIDIGLKKEEPVKLILFDISGKEIVTDYQTELEGKNSYLIKVDLQNLKNSVYFYQVKTGDSIKSGKIVVLN